MAPDMPFQHSRILLSTGIDMHFVHLAPSSRAKGTVLCVHGFPDTWFGFRHQIRALASKGWHVIVPDQRGYGETSAPLVDAAKYCQEELCGDMCALLDALGLASVVLLGHDWGGTLVWNMAQQFPDRVRAVASVCTPFFANNPAKNPWESMRKNPGRFDYQVWFQSAEAEAELSADPYYTVKCTIRGTGSDDVKGFLEGADPSLVAQAPTVKGGLLKGFPPRARCPRSEILTEDELRYYAAQFSRSGYFGPLSWYRNVERNWRWMCSRAGQKVLQPALIVTAGRDPVLKASMVESLKMKDWIPVLVHRHIEECGHWVLQEKAAEANKHICDWLDSLGEAPPSKL
ncbi:EPHX2 [Symbiodinium sp. CCMP2592]|nr:EPHX2 [Symbiodinium sp. CCMP2592]